MSVALFCGSCSGADCSRSWTWGTRRTSWRRFEEIILADEENTSKTFETQKQKTTHKECFSIKRANRNSSIDIMLINLQWTIKIKDIIKIKITKDKFVKLIISKCLNDF